MNAPLAFFFNEMIAENDALQQTKLTIVQDSAASHCIKDSQSSSCTLPQLNDGSSSRWESSPVTRETSSTDSTFGPKMPLRRPIRRTSSTDSMPLRRPIRRTSLDDVEKQHPAAVAVAAAAALETDPSSPRKTTPKYVNDMAFYRSTIQHGKKTQTSPKSLRSMAA